MPQQDGPQHQLIREPYVRLHDLEIDRNKHVQPMDSIFALCVQILMGIAELTGLTYEQVNVIIFVVLLPLGLIALLARTVWLERRLVEMGEARSLTG